MLLIKKDAGEKKGRIPSHVPVGVVDVSLFWSVIFSLNRKNRLDNKNKLVLIQLEEFVLPKAKKEGL